MQRYKWAVVGAGPAGIATVGKLIDNGAEPRSIAWIDPCFGVGDLGKKWSNVPGNTKLYRLALFLRGSEAFGYDERKVRFPHENLDPDRVYTLHYAVEPMLWITEQLRNKVDSMETTATKLKFVEGEWNLMTNHGDLSAKKVVLAIGSEPKRLDYAIPAISLEHVLDTGKIGRAVRSDDVVAVFGSSHSAIMSIRNLTDFGVERVINFYRSPIRYAVDYGDWVLHDNTGLKGDTAEWAKQHLGNGEFKTLLRVEASDLNIERYLSDCSKVVYGIGFDARSIQIDGFETRGYDDRTGVMGPGLFGAGIAFPERVVDKLGNTEYNVGILKFIRYLDRVVHIWMSENENATSKVSVPNIDCMQKEF